MTDLAHIQQALASDGLQAERLSLDEQGEPAAESLLLPLRIDSVGRQHQLLIQLLPGTEEGLSSAILSLSLRYPFYIADLSNAPELMRLLLWLNRLVPFGRYGLMEDARGVDFVYQLVIDPSQDITPSLLLETVGTLAWTTQQHADIIEQVLSGAVSTDEVLQAIAEQASENSQQTTP